MSPLLLLLVLLGGLDVARAVIGIAKDPQDAAALVRGARQVAARWRPEDGDQAAFTRFLREQWLSDRTARDELFSRYDAALESIFGHLHEIRMDLSQRAELDLGSVRPFDELLSQWSPSAHASEDLFGSKIAFAALLHLPVSTLSERLQAGARWSRRQWAEARMAQRFSRRVPADVEAAVARAYASAEAYIASYNVHLHHVLGPGGERFFAPGLKLITHWGLRDEIRGRYADPQGLPRQRLIASVMEHIVRGTIPRAVVDDPRLDWTPSSGLVVRATLEKGEVAPEGRALPRDPSAPEGTERYAQIVEIFRAVRRVDPHTPELPTHIRRSFEEGREMPEAEVKGLLEAVLTSPLVPRVAALVRKRLGRALEPFDLWYPGLRPRPRISEDELDAMVKQRYPTVGAFQADLPGILGRLGFDAKTASYLAGKIAVDPARGAGHASGAERRGSPSRLRTRIPAGGMNYKGYNIAVHELGHNVEQTFSLDRIDHYVLHGVPNTAFTEALAFVFQSRDLELLGLGKTPPEAEHQAALNDFWATYEIAGVALVDLAMWHWLYDHPEATPAALRDATVQIARDVWNRYYAPIFGVRDVLLLGIYSHMVDAGLYLPDYPLGHLIAFQIEAFLRGRSLAREMERMCKQGLLTPDAWMRGAVGAPVSVEPMLRAAERALSALGG